MGAKERPGGGGRPAQDKENGEGWIQSTTPPCSEQAPRARKRTPLQTIRRECLTCMGCGKQDQAGHIRECPSRDTCALWPYRLGKRPATVPNRPLKAIHGRCIECVGSAHEVRKCTGEMMDGTSCVLHPFRFGTNPSLKGKRGRQDIFKYSPHHRPSEAETRPEMGGEVVR